MRVPCWSWRLRPAPYHRCPFESFCPPICSRIPYTAGRPRRARRRRRRRQMAVMRVLACHVIFGWMQRRGEIVSVWQRWHRQTEPWPSRVWWLPLQVDLLLRFGLLERQRELAMRRLPLVNRDRSALEPQVRSPQVFAVRKLVAVP